MGRYRGIKVQPNASSINAGETTPGKVTGVETYRIGKEFEDQLKVAGSLYRMKHLAKFEKNEVPVIVKNGRPIYRQKKGFDFFGVISSMGGKCLVFEAKHIEKELRINKPATGKNEGSGLQAHQLVALLEYRAMNAEAFVLWSNERGVYRIDPEFLEKYVGYGHALSVAEAELLAKSDHSIHVVRMRGGVIDFLELL